MYVAGGVSDSRTEIFHINRAGDRKLLAVLPFASALRMSPTMHSVAMVLSAANDDIAVYNLDSSSTTRLSLEPGDEWSPVWTADGTRVVYTSAQPPPRLLMRRADGGGEAIELLRSERPSATSCSPDGTMLLYFDHDPATGFDLWLLPLDGRGKQRPFLRTPFNETAARFSPDGKWIAYMSDETGSSQVYVRSASTDGGRWQLSAAGGGSPLWSFDGREVFYRSGNDIFTVPLSISGSRVRAEKPRLLFSLPTFWSYDVVPDGFVISREASARSAIRHVNVVLNWKRALTSLMR